ncbi:MAG: hypothetical protein ACLQPD_18240 [Desulfomonilaceae bacterium]
MAYKRKIIAEHIVQDIRSGMNNALLMEKYMLSERGLNKIFRKLLDHEAMTPDELSPRMASYADLDSLDYLRESSLKELVCLVPIYEEDLKHLRGSVCELTETSIGVTGLDAAVGDIRKFVIPADEFFSIPAFSFDAICRWVEERNESTESVSAYEITDISNKNYQRLKQLIRLIKLPA